MTRLFFQHLIDLTIPSFNHVAWRQQLLIKRNAYPQKSDSLESTRSPAAAALFLIKTATQHDLTSIQIRAFNQFNKVKKISEDR